MFGVGRPEQALLVAVDLLADPARYVSGRVQYYRLEVGTANRTRPMTGYKALAVTHCSVLKVRETNAKPPEGVVKDPL